MKTQYSEKVDRHIYIEGGCETRADWEELAKAALDQADLPHAVRGDDTVKLSDAWRKYFELWTDGTMLRDKGDGTEGNKLWNEAAKLWDEAIKEAHGDITIEWKKWNDVAKSYECHLSTGDVFGFDEKGKPVKKRSTIAANHAAAQEPGTVAGSAPMLRQRAARIDENANALFAGVRKGSGNEM